MTILSLALDDLAEVAASTPDSAATRATLASAVLLLERAAGADLGSAAGDPVVALQRRLGRAHLRLATVAPADLDTHLAPERVQAHADALRCPDAPVVGALSTAPRPVGALAGC